MGKKKKKGLSKGAQKAYEAIVLCTANMPPMDLKPTLIKDFPGSVMMAPDRRRG